MKYIRRFTAYSPGLTIPTVVQQHAMIEVINEKSQHTRLFMDDKIVIVAQKNLATECEPTEYLW
jgi:hypothetical protein